MATHPSKRIMVAVLAAVLVLFVAAIAITVDNRSENLTAWATVKARELHNFMQECRDNGGTMDTRSNQAPEIVFVCEYPDRTVEYTLETGNPRKA